MLYRTPHRPSLRHFVRRLAASLAPHRGRVAEQDLAALSPHLLRDLGLLDAGLDELVGRK
jgi:uncharacterized protein YjiS (DUF1127 family)